MIRIITEEGRVSRVMKLINGSYVEMFPGVDYRVVETVDADESDEEIVELVNPLMSEKAIDDTNDLPNPITSSSPFMTNLTRQLNSS